MQDFPWIKSYPKEITNTINEPESSSLDDFFEKKCAQYSDKVAFENFSVRMTYRQLNMYATHFAAYLHEGLGLQKGDRIAIQIPNLLQFPIAFFGAIKAGLIVVTLNPLYTSREMKGQLLDSKASVIVILSNFASQLEAIKDEVSLKHIIVTNMGDMLGFLKGGLVNFVVKRIKKMVPAYHIPEAISFTKTLKRGALLSYKKIDITWEDTALLQYTGGTTGEPKAAKLSHKNLLFHNEMVVQWFAPFVPKNEENIIITALPMYHIFALTINGIMMFSMGIKNVLITNPRDMHSFVKELGKHKFTIITGVNTLYNGLMNTRGFEGLDFSSLSISISGGMALQQSIGKRWKQITKSSIIEGYGLSETSPVLCCNLLDGNHKDGTVGLPIPGTEIAIMDEKGNPIPEGSKGEVCARGPQVMEGYWQRDNSETFFPGGWFKTGDIGIMDREGFLKIVDRKKDIIIVSGFNVYPNEVEDVIASHPKVQEVAVVGIVNSESGEVVKAFISKKEPSLTEEEIIQFCHTKLTRYKIPKIVIFQDDLPKSTVGKILRRQLK